MLPFVNSLALILYYLGMKEKINGNNIVANAELAVANEKNNLQFSR